MRCPYTIGAVALALWLLLAAPAFAESFRCAGGLVQTGDIAAAVLSACGEPSFVDPWIAGPSLAFGVAPSMEEWTYNRGRSRLLQILVFRDGELLRIRNDGYGFSASRGASSCRPAEIAQGMSKYRLLQMCGPPTQNSGFFVFSSRRRAGGREFFTRRGGVPVFRERWIYNFGANRLLREVTLENAIVVDTDTLERGFDE